MSTKKEKVIHEADGITFDSREELEFYFWLLVAQHNGIVERFEYHPQTFELIPRQSVTVTVQLKTKTKPKDKFLFHSCEYTPDFMIVPGEHWHLLNLDLNPDENGCYWIDIKGNWMEIGLEKYFSVIQKLCLFRCGIYANKIIPQDLFKKTYVPKKAAFNLNGTRRKRYQNCKFYKEFTQAQNSLI